MNDIKNDAPIVLPDQSTSSSASNITSNNSTIAIIAQKAPQNQGKKRGGKRGWNANGHRMLLIDDKVRSLAIKCYDEQLPKGKAFTEAMIKQADPKEFHIVAIWHYKDRYSEDGSPWKTAFEKPHFHIILRFAYSKSDRVNKLLNMLGVYFRPGIDDELWQNHGVETVDTFEGYLTYLTHETKDAIRDAKEPYDRNELISNLTPDELDQVRDGYFRLSNGKHKVTAEELISLDDQAYQLGLELKNFDAWYDTLSLAERSSTKMRTIKESYERGVNNRVEKNAEVLRLCVFIQGEGNCGKTYASRAALVGKRIKTIEGGKTGKFDDLKADHDAILVSDDTCPNLLNMCDNYICRAYKRQKDNPAWAGRYFIATSNLEFDDWVKECGIKSKKHFDAIRSRFFICKVREGDAGNYLALLSPSIRGTVQEQQERAGMFMDFQQKFNASMANYRPDEERYDFSEMIDPEYRTVEQQMRVDDKHVLDELGITIVGSYDQKEIREAALKKFALWFWESPSGPWTQCVKCNPVYRGDIEYGRQFIQEYPESSLKQVVNQFIDYQHVGTFPIDVIRDAVESVLDLLDM